MAGTWTPLQNQPNFKTDTMLLLTDGTVMCHDYQSRNWHKLTPDSSGNYLNGTWSSMAPLPDNPDIPANIGGPTNAPRYFASAVLRDGTVFVAGGEDNTNNSHFSGSDILSTQIYDPVSDTWKIVNPPTGWTQIGDAPSCVLPDGRLLLGNKNSTRTAIYDPVQQTWTAAANKGDSNSEETFTLLPDNTVLTVQCSNIQNAEKYIIAMDKWVSAGSTPSTLPQVCSNPAAEIGPAILLPGGHVFAIGATGNTALYSPPANPSDAGSWAPGPTLKDGNGNTSFPMDAGAVLLPNGKVLCVGSPSPPCNYPGPTTFFEYDPQTNLASVVTSPSNNGGPCYQGRFLLLPTGQVLFSANTAHIEVYTPDGNPYPAWRPSITSVPATLVPGCTYTLTGTQLNGLSQAVSYGDDAQMATNYPLIQLKNTTTGVVVYPRTFKHSTMGVQTGAAIHSTNFTVPAFNPGPAQLCVIANGISSDLVNVIIGVHNVLH
jgi:hypothetical protein